MTTSSRVPYILIEQSVFVVSPPIRSIEGRNFTVRAFVISRVPRPWSLWMCSVIDKSVRRTLVSLIISMKADEVYCVYKATMRKFSLADQPKAQCEALTICTIVWLYKATTRACQIIRYTVPPPDLLFLRHGHVLSRVSPL